MNIKPCGTYQAHIEDCTLVRMPDGKSAFKIYFVSIVGRPNRERFEWEHCPLNKASFVEAFRASGREGIGFVCAFPHITKVFVFPPRAEVLLDVCAFDTATGASISLEKENGYYEFACLAEAVIAQDEYLAWAAAADVAGYLEHVMPSGEAAVAANDKLARYFNAD